MVTVDPAAIGATTSIWRRRHKASGVPRGRGVCDAWRSRRYCLMMRSLFANAVRDDGAALLNWLAVGASPR